MKKIGSMLAILLVGSIGGACQAQSTAAAAAVQPKVLVAYFSRGDENYSVGRISKGNTQKVAEEIARQTRGTLFRIETVRTYPTTYREATEAAQQEKTAQARPALKTAVPDLTGYDTVYIGYPIWWGDMPMAVYTFLESADLAGKTVYPFLTHEGSGVSGTDRKIAAAASKASVRTPLALKGSVAQKDAAAVQKAVSDWLKK